MLVVDALNLIFIKRRIRFLMLKDEIFTQRSKHEMIILININDEKIFMSQFFVKNAQIPESEHATIMMRVINDYKIFSYDVHNLAFFFADNERRR